MAPLVPIVLLGIAAAGDVSAAPPLRPLDAGAELGTRYRGRTEQGRSVALRLARDRRSAAWRVLYDYRCSDGTRGRGRFASGAGTPRVRIGSDGSLELERSEPTRFAGGGAGSARYSIRGRLGRGGGAGTWRLRLTRTAGSSTAACTTGPVRWRVERAAPAGARS
ncbi:MAG TPA: hypothetical protein VF520_15695 [Thermoleophilaceae bacterium]